MMRCHLAPTAGLFKCYRVQEKATIGLADEVARAAAAARLAASATATNMVGAFDSLPFEAACLLCSCLSTPGGAV